MLCFAMLCYAMLCYAMPWYAGTYVPVRTGTYRHVPARTFTPTYTQILGAIDRELVCSATPRPMPCYAILCYGNAMVMLCYAMLCYAMLC